MSTTHSPTRHTRSDKANDNENLLLLFDCSSTSSTASSSFREEEEDEWNDTRARENVRRDVAGAQGRREGGSHEAGLE